MSKKLLDLEILYPSHSIKSILEIGAGFCVKKLKVPFPSTFLKILNESLIILCGGLNKKKNELSQNINTSHSHLSPHQLKMKLNRSTKNNNGPKLKRLRP